MNASSYSIFLLSLRSKLHHHDLSLSCDLSQEVPAGSVSRRVQALANREQANKKLDFFVPYTILPLDHGGIRQAIMQLNEIKAAIAVVCNVCGLPSTPDFQRHGEFIVLFDFLQN